MATSLCYLLIQGPAYAYARDPQGKEDPDEVLESVVDTEHWWPLTPKS